MLDRRWHAGTAPSYNLITLRWGGPPPHTRGRERGLVRQGLTLARHVTLGGPAHFLLIAVLVELALGLRCRVRQGESEGWIEACC